MKTLIHILILLCGSNAAFAQGTVTFQNSVLFTTLDPSGRNRLVYCGGVPLTGTNYVAELYAGTSAGSLAPLTASISRFRGSTTAASNRGKWLATGIFGPNGAIVLPMDFGGNAFLQVKVWDVNTSLTFETATGYASQSLIFAYKIPGAGDMTPSDFYMEAMQSFGPLSCIPEPSAITLGILGVTGLLLIRRRK